MRAPALVLVLSLAAVAHADTSCPTQAPRSDWLYPKASCGTSQFCATGQQALMTIANYPPDCAPPPPGPPIPGSCSVYQIQACDTATWHFGDGTPDVSGPAADPVMHTFAQPGSFRLEVTISNALGSVPITGLTYITANPPATVAFSKYVYDVMENAGSATATLVRSGNLSITSTAQWNGPSLLSGVVTFAPGDTTKTITVPIENDSLFGSEAYLPIHARASDGTILDEVAGDAWIHVIDDDPPPSVAINDVAVAEGDSGTHLATFTVTMSQPMLVDAWINFSIHDGTAISGRDYDAAGVTGDFFQRGALRIWRDRAAERSRFRSSATRHPRMTSTSP